MDNTIIAALLGVVGGLLGVLAGSSISRKSSMEAIIASNKNTLDLMRKQDFNRAAATFRCAFVNQLNVLKSNVNSGRGDTSNVGEYLRAHYVGYHLSAFETFRNYLSTSEREAIDKAWNEYCNFAQYSDKNKQEEMRELALKNLNEILKFAKHK